MHVAFSPHKTFSQVKTGSAKKIALIITVENAENLWDRTNKINQSYVGYNLSQLQQFEAMKLSLQQHKEQSILPTFPPINSSTLAYN